MLWTVIQNSVPTGPVRSCLRAPRMDVPLPRTVCSAYARWIWTLLVGAGVARPK